MRIFIFSLAVSIILSLGCQDIPRDNVLDPQNPGSYQAPTILLDAFVNTSNPLDYNEFALQALDSIKANYGDRVVIAEYHRNSRDYPDPLSIDDSELLYEKYVQHSTSAVEGVPDIFINGIGNRVQGAASVHNVVYRLNKVLSDEVTTSNYFTLEPGKVTFSGSELNATCKIARLGSTSADDLLLKIILLKRVNSSDLKRVVTKIRKSGIPSLEAGEIKAQEFTIGQLNEQPDDVLFVLTSADELNVYQSIKVELQ